MGRRPNPARSGKDGWAPMATWRVLAVLTTVSIVSRSPACAPHATLAEVITANSSLSVPAPSPKSALRSMTAAPVLVLVALMNGEMTPPASISAPVEDPGAHQSHARRPGPAGVGEPLQVAFRRVEPFVQTYLPVGRRQVRLGHEEQRARVAQSQPEFDTGVGLADEAHVPDIKNQVGIDPRDDLLKFLDGIRLGDHVAVHSRRIGAIMADSAQRRRK